MDHRPEICTEASLTLKSCITKLQVKVVATGFPTGSETRDRDMVNVYPISESNYKRYEFIVIFRCKKQIKKTRRVHDCKIVTRTLSDNNIKRIEIHRIRNQRFKAHEIYLFCPKTCYNRNLRKKIKHIALEIFF